VEDRAYFDFTLMLHRIKLKIFCYRIKTNTVYKSIQELDLPDAEDQDIIKDEIVLNSNKAIETGISEQN
jgi:hypothetical protein